MSELEKFSQVLSILYEAAAEPVLWTQFLDELNTALQAGHACVTAVGREPSQHRVLLQGYTPEEERAYREYYRDLDVVLQSLIERHAREAYWHGSAETLVPPATMERTELYNDFMLPAGVHHGGIVSQRGRGDYSMVGLAVWRDRREKPFEPNELKILEMLGPHLEQGFALNVHLSQLRAEKECLKAGLDASSIALIGLDARGSVMTISDAAQRLVYAHDGLEMTDRALKASDAVSDRKLQALISHAVALATRTDAGGLVREAPATWAVQVRRMGKRPLRVVVFPFRSELPLLGTRPAVLLFVSDPQAAFPSRSEVAQQLFSLSAIQGKLADLLVSGVDLKAAAIQLGITYDSARFQLKEVFRRTGTHKQSELTRTLMEIPSRMSVAAPEAARKSNIGT